MFSKKKIIPSDVVELFKKRKKTLLDGFTRKFSIIIVIRYKIKSGRGSSIYKLWNNNKSYYGSKSFSCSLVC
jgi:hypothetical protein